MSSKLLTEIIDFIESHETNVNFEEDIKIEENFELNDAFKIENINVSQLGISNEIQQKLKHQFLVVRKQALEDLTKHLKENISNLCKLEKFVFVLLSNNTWQSTQSAFLLSSYIIPYSNSLFKVSILNMSFKYFENKEHRVRESVAECLGVLAKYDGINVYLKCKKKLLNLINNNLTRDNVDASSLTSLKNSILNKKTIINPIDINIDGIPILNNTNNNSNNKNKNNNEKLIIKKKCSLKHDSEGWKCLYSSLKTIERIIIGLGDRFSKEITNDFLDLLDKTRKHINRFVREITYFIYNGICISLNENGLNKIGNRIALILKLGLSDNWSQVRYSSSIATRSFFNKLSKDKYSNYFNTLLGPMCLNRRYVAAGVRTYSLDTWKKVVEMNGRKYIAKHIKSVVDYYSSQAKADNHAVREAACHCIAELGTKIDKNSVRPYINILLDSLISCFKDMSWPVRDAACVSLGDFVSSFPNESKNDLSELYNLWYEHLSDNIASVRENSAISLGKVISVLGKESLNIAISHLKNNLTKVKKQSKDSKLFNSLNNSTLFGVAAKKMRDNDPDLHSGQQHYSCGSLAPKLERGIRGSGCMDHGFHRERELWEYSDGCIHLFKELCIIDSNIYDMFINDISQISYLKHFSHFAQLQVTIWKCIIIIAKSIGIRKYKLYLELLIPPMIETLECKNRLAMNAAANCLQFSCNFLGSKFFLGRVSEEQLKVLRKSSLVKV